MTTKTILLCILSAAGCGSVSDSRVIGDAGTADADTGSDRGSDTTPPAIGPITGHVFDERNDAIEFSSGVPVHTHAGATVDLSTGCPDVYKYAYLMDDHAPVYGSEVLPNPLAFQIAAPGATSAMYRVRSDTATLRDWTPMIAGGGTYAIALHRNDTSAMQAIGTQVGTFYLDAKLVDATGETTRTACWHNHPMAAPLEIMPAQPSSFFDFSFALRSPMQLAMNGEDPAAGSFGAPIGRLTFVQQTAEPVTLALGMAAPPTATGTKQLVKMFVPSQASPPYTVEESCGTSSCPMAPASSRATTTQALGGAWELIVYPFEDSGAELCRQRPGSNAVPCQIPPRSPGAAAKTYGIYLFLANADAISPDVANPTAQTFASQLLDNLWVVGLFSQQLDSYCSAEVTKSVLHYCTQRTSYQQVTAVNHATLVFDPMHFTLSASATDLSAALVPAYLAPTALTLGSRVWDSGVAGL